MAVSTADLDHTEGGYIQSVVRAADIIRLLTQDGVMSISVAEASKALGLQRPTAHRYMATLSSVRLLQREPGSSRFTLGPLAHEIFAAIMRDRRVLAVAPSRMQRLADETACSVALGIWDGSTALVSHMMYPRPSSPAVRIPVGYHVAPTGAQTIMFAAFLADSRQAQAVLDKVPASEIGQVEQQLARARAEHFVEVSQDNGIRIIAAPVFDVHGICATVALLSTFSQLPSGSASEQARLLRETARQLSAELGHASAHWPSSAH